MSRCVQSISDAICFFFRAPPDHVLRIDPTDTARKYSLLNTDRHAIFLFLMHRIPVCFRHTRIDRYVVRPGPYSNMLSAHSDK